MKTFLFTFFSFLLSCSSLFAYEHTIIGRFVEYHSDQISEIRFQSDDFPLDTTILANDEGHFAFTFEVTTSIAAPVRINISYYDYCITQVIPLQIQVASTGVTEVELGERCGDPDDECYAAFIPIYESEDHLTVVFTDESWTPNITSVHWDFGDGHTSTEFSPTHSYEMGGEYIVTYQITTADSCTAITETVLQVGRLDWYMQCVAFIYYIPHDFIPERIQFYSETILPVIGYEWDFGDGTTSNEAHPEHIYAADGEYEIRLKTILVEGGDTCVAEAIDFINIQIDTSGESHCKADFDMIQQGEGSNLFAFVDYSIATSEIVSWEWAFSDGVILTDQHVEREFDFNGNVEVTLSITTSDGCESIVTYNLWVGDWNQGDCHAIFEWHHIDIDSGGYGIQFMDFSEGEDIQNWHWDFGDGNSSTEQHPVHIYNEEGNYIVKLNIIANDSCISIFQASINIGSCVCPDIYDPVCVFDPATGEYLEFGNPCEAECAGYTDFMPCEEYCHCDDYFDPVCAYTDAGELIRFPNPCQAQCEGYHDFFHCDDGQECSAYFSWQSNVTDSINYTIQFFGPATDDIIETNWDFGDGNTSFEHSPVHTYEEEGVFYVTLSILTVDSCSNTVSQAIYIGRDEGCVCPEFYDPVCVIDHNTGDVLTFSNHCFAECEGYFDFFPCDDGGGDGGENDDRFCQAMFWFNTEDNLTVQFEDLSMTTDETVSWEWDFGDGNSGNEMNPSHTYAEEGIYFVTLTVRDAELCSSTFSMLVWTSDGILYSEACRALFFPIVQDNSVLLLDVSQGDVVEWQWDLGDGTIANTPFVQHIYETVGEVTITLTITTRDGCTSSFAIVLNVDSGNFHGASNPDALSTSTQNIKASPVLVEISPNPTTALTQLSINSTQNTDYQVLISNNTGQIVQQKIGQLSLGEQKIELDLNQLPTGVYIMTMRSAGQVYSQKIVKL